MTTFVNVGERSNVCNSNDKKKKKKDYNGDEMQWAYDYKTWQGMLTLVK